MTNRKLGVLAIATAAFAGACADPAGPGAKTLLTMPTMNITSEVITHPGPDPVVGVWGTVELCKTSNVGGNYQFTISENGVANLLVTSPYTITIPTGGGTVCVDVYVSTVGFGAAENVTITETTNANLAEINIIQYKQSWVPPNPLNYSANELDDTPTNFQPGNAATAVLNINSDMARRVTFVNFTPAAICDFVTFGRLVWEHNGQKVVISGNAGGNSPHGGFLNEFHIEVNGVDHHVADITSYGPIASAPLASSTYTNSRRAAGLDKHGHAVELRVWDGGEPGWKFDRFWFNVNGTVVGNATTGNLIDQGNMQYHSNCRGPGN